MYVLGLRAQHSNPAGSTAELQKYLRPGLPSRRKGRGNRGREKGERKRGGRRKGVRKERGGRKRKEGRKEGEKGVEGGSSAHSHLTDGEGCLLLAKKLVLVYFFYDI